jgi:hypothetical protein
MEHFSFFSENFAISQSQAYILSLQAGENSYAYTLADAIRNEYVAVKSADYDPKIKERPVFEKIKTMIQDDAFLNKSYKAINFAFLTRKSVLVPSPLFDKNSLKKLFRLNHPLNETEELHFNYIEAIDAYNAFALPSKITTFMVNHFPEIRFFHHSTSFITQAFADEKKVKFKLPSFRININDGFVDFLLLKGDKLLFYNTFSYQSNTDIAYHALNVLKQLEISASKCYVFLSGNISGDDSELYVQLKHFLPSASVVNPITDFIYSFEEAPAHLLYNVLNLHKCE